MKIYTKSGDRGETSLYNGTRVSKTVPTLQALGDVDELNSAVGLAREYTFLQDNNAPVLEQVNSGLVALGIPFVCLAGVRSVSFVGCGFCRGYTTQQFQFCSN